MWPWLLSIGQWLVKLIGGWLPIGTKPVSEWLGKVLWAVGISVAVFFLMTNLSKTPGMNSPQNINSKGDVETRSFVMQPRFGCATVNNLPEKKTAEPKEVTK